MQKWRKFTIAAASAPIGVLIVCGGICLLFPPAAAVVAAVGPLAAAGVAVGLGLAAGAAKSNYNSLMVEVRKAEKEMQQKMLLRTDLGGLNTNVALVSPALRTFRNNLDEISGLWNNVSMDLAFIVNNYPDSKLADLTWLNQTMRILDAQNKWKEIAGSTQNFTRNSLVSYDMTPTFGQEINEAA